MNIKEFICDTLGGKECIPFDMQKALEKAQSEAESNYSYKQKMLEKSLLPCYGTTN